MSATPDRVARMTGRVGRAALDAGLSAADAERLAALHERVTRARLEGLSSEDDPRALHPGRTLLVLLTDTDVRRPDLLAGALLLEGEEEDLRVPATQAEAWDFRASAVAADVPRPSDPDLAERLVLADPDLARLALAERLDHLRHLHLGPRDDTVRAAAEQAARVWLPLAERTDARLARRYAWWVRRVAPKLR